MDRAAGMDRGGEPGNERLGRGNGVPGVTWQAVVATAVVAVGMGLFRLMNLVTRIKDAIDTLLWIFSLFERVLTDEFPNGGCCVFSYLTKWAFVPTVLVSVAMGIYIGYTFARTEIENAEDILQWPANNVLRLFRVAVIRFRNIDHSTIEEVVVET